MLLFNLSNKAEASEFFSITLYSRSEVVVHIAVLKLNNNKNQCDCVCYIGREEESCAPTIATWTQVKPCSLTCQYDALVYLHFATFLIEHGKCSYWACYLIIGQSDEDLNVRTKPATTKGV